MAGYQEFKAGSIWFYYNQDATKTLERSKELGALTCRPVVVVQSAYYPEWTENITVVPMTSSERRSGIHIDTTVLTNGGIVEGGTVLPYLLYTIKTRYLHPITVTGKQNFLALLSLSDEDWAKVRDGVAYHLGYSDKEPEYVTHWKRLDDYGRNLLVRSVQVAVTDFETHTQLFHNIDQVKDGTNLVENHLVASMNHVNDSRTGFVETPCTESTAKKAINLTFNRYILTEDADNDAFFQFLEDNGMNEFFDQTRNTVDCWYEGSEKLKGVQSCDAVNVLTPFEMKAFLELKGKEMWTMTGITSSSTAYRTRRSIEAWLEEHPNATKKNMHCCTHKTRAINEIFPARCKANAKRWKFVLGITQEDIDFIFNKAKSDKDMELKFLRPVSYHRSKDFLELLHKAPPSEPKLDENGNPAPKEPKTLYEATARQVDHCKRSPKLEYWKTLSPQEIAEISSISKRNMGETCKKYKFSKQSMKTLQAHCISALRHKDLREVTIEDLNVPELQKLMDGNMHVDTSIMYLFCVANYTQIMDAFNKHGCAKTPSKQAILAAKTRVRNLIAVKPAG